jgi:hypothetical protein
VVVVDRSADRASGTSEEERHVDIDAECAYARALLSVIGSRPT